MSFFLFQDIEKDEGIFVLTDKNYEKAVKEYPNLLVQFYAPWCGHCKALGPEFVKAAQGRRRRREKSGGEHWFRRVQS